MRRDPVSDSPLRATAAVARSTEHGPDRSLPALLAALEGVAADARPGRAEFYVGERRGGQAVVYVVTRAAVTRLPRLRRDPRRGLDWPGPGPGADRLARALLADAGAGTAARRLAAAFRAEVVDELDRREFVLEADEVHAWLRGHRRRRLPGRVSVRRRCARAAGSATPAGGDRDDGGRAGHV